MPVTPAQFGQTFTEGIKYIKLNKLDKNGLDNSNRLQQADSIIINYPDIGPQEYVIVSTQPQQDYYLLGLVNNPNTSSLNEILDYNFIAYRDASGNPFSITTSPQLLVGNLGTPTVTDNTLGYFTGSGVDAYTWTLHNTPNIENFFLKISGSINNSGVITTLTFGLINNKSSEGIAEPILQLTQSVSTGVDIIGGGAGLLEINLTQFNFPLIENNSFTFQVSANNSGIDLTELYIIISGSTPPITTSSSLVTFTPEEDFYYSDYNALFGNAEIPQFSNHFMDVDYTSDFTTPVNFDLIISGTADRAQISDSNYSSFAWSNIRYRGSKYNSYKI